QVREHPPLDFRLRLGRRHPCAHLSYYRPDPVGQQPGLLDRYPGCCPGAAFPEMAVGGLPEMLERMVIVEDLHPTGIILADFLPDPLGSIPDNAHVGAVVGS